ncbi:Origin recognition complex subunit 5 [Tieghemiomyces parasiticus]|uniref:Origin recognition complex subunit 5 n=1 Tax=Tieghemiomyces parasiticus TaxID=78921 RepID=A0A9W8ABN0_9FUNG|nr:Origin recognition complex subunit 5 [Tieghemiomyces parasiticus]
MAALVPSLSDLEQCIVTQFPGRTTQARRLLQYLGQPDDPSPPFLFLYGPESTGKTSLARTVLAGTSPATSTAYVNCIERYTPRLIFDHILAQFSGSNPCYETGFFNRFQCNSTQEFVTTLAREIPIAERHRTRYIVSRDLHFWYCLQS